VIHYINYVWVPTGNLPLDTPLPPQVVMVSVPQAPTQAAAAAAAVEGGGSPSPPAPLLPSFAELMSHRPALWSKHKWAPGVFARTADVAPAPGQNPRYKGRVWGGVTFYTHTHTHRSRVLIVGVGGCGCGGGAV